MVKLGLICFANESGLGNQTRRLAYMLKPDKLLVINSASFSKNTKQYLEWYDGFKGYKVRGFPNDQELHVFLRELTHVMVCESPFNYSLFSIAKRQGIKTFCQVNYEFCDNLNKPQLPTPDVFLMPSYWKIEEMKERFTHVEHLPPPINPQEFKNARDTNFKRTGQFKFLHIIGTLAVHDRNGTLDLLAALEHTKADFSLTIRSQHILPQNYLVNDPRVRYIIGSEQSLDKVYEDYDALVLPRRYGGLALTCNEALMSGLPVLMPDISPNNKLLPKEWLINAAHSGSFMTRTAIDIYRSDPKHLAFKMEWLTSQDREKQKTTAFELGFNHFSDSALKPKYQELFNRP